MINFSDEKNSRAAEFIKNKLGEDTEYDFCLEINKADNYDSILISYKVNPHEAIAIQKYIYCNTGVVPYMIVRNNPHYPEYRYMYPTEVYSVLKDGAFPDTFAIQFGGLYGEKIKTKLGAEFEALRDKINIAGWTITRLIENFDSEKTWQEMYDLGYRMIMTNNYLELVKFAHKKIK